MKKVNVFVFPSPLNSEILDNFTDEMKCHFFPFFAVVIYIDLIM